MVLAYVGKEVSKSFLVQFTPKLTNQSDKFLQPAKMWKLLERQVPDFVEVA